MNKWIRYKDWMKDRKAKTLLRRYSEINQYSILLDSYTSSRCWEAFKNNYQYPIVAPIFDLFKKFSSKQQHPTSQKSMLEPTAEMKHKVQSMTDLTELTPNLMLDSGILHSPDRLLSVNSAD